MPSPRPRASIGLLVAGVSAGLLLASSWLDAWGRVSIRGASLGRAGRLPATSSGFDAWEGFGPVLQAALAASLTVAVVVAALIVSRRAHKRPGIVLLLAIVMSSLFVAGAAPGPDLDGLERLGGVNVSRGALVVTGYGLCALTVLGGVLHLRSARTPG
ncbi:MAG: hypothetical protein ACRDKZ_02860 [Actinomycetota bacterium]